MIRDCGLSRNGGLRLFAGGLHGELQQHYDRYRSLRHPDDDRLFFFFDAFADGGVMHTFTFHVDDSTSAEHLIIVDFEHESRRMS
jgi:hypothetical protein